MSKIAKYPPWVIAELLEDLLETAVDYGYAMAHNECDLEEEKYSMAEGKFRMALRQVLGREFPEEL